MKFVFIPYSDESYLKEINLFLCCKATHNLWHTLSKWMKTIRTPTCQQMIPFTYKGCLCRFHKHYLWNCQTVFVMISQWWNALQIKISLLIYNWESIDFIVIVINLIISLMMELQNTLHFVHIFMPRNLK